MTTETTTTNDTRCIGRISNGWVSGHRCTKQGQPEPAMRASFEYRTGEVVQEPNVNWNGRPQEGLYFCGTHSPSRKAARLAAKEQEKYGQRRAQRQEYKEQEEKLDAEIALLKGITGLTMEQSRALNNVCRLARQAR